MPGACALILACASAFAETIEINIEAQGTEQALLEFAEHTGYQIIFEKGIAGDSQSPAVRGELDIGAALQTLLAGSGLVFEFVSDELIIVKRSTTQSVDGERPDSTGFEERRTTVLANDQKKQFLKKLAAIAAAAFTTTAGAQTEGVVIEEITVTAQKREQNIQDIGISITAQSGEYLRQQSAFTAAEVALQTPGLNIGTPIGEGNNPSIVLRGVGLNDFGDNNESPVAVYVDGVYQASLAGQAFQLFDLERVEVLRGPQGTLYGRNTTGGLVHFISSKPTDEFEGYVDLTVGSFSQVRAEGVISGPLSDNWTARLSVASNQHNGWMDNQNPADSTDPNDGDNVAGRLQLQYAGERNTALLSVRASRNDSFAAAFKHAASFNNANGLAELLPRNVDFYGTCPGCDVFAYIDDTGERYAGRYDEIGVNNIESFGASLEIDLDFESFSLTSITAVGSMEKVYREDTDMTPDPFSVLENTADNDQFSQEFRLAGSTDNVEWVTGLYYFDLENRLGNSLDLSGIGFIDLGAVIQQDTESWAAFGQLEYQLSDSWKIVGGLRYSHETKNYSYVSTDANGIIPGNAFDFRPETVGKLAKQSDDSIDFRLGLDFKPSENILWYFAIARGHKGAGFNQGFFDSSGIFGSDDPEVIPFGPEELTSYEIGFKSNIGNRTQLNVTAYYYDYKDFQALSFRQLSQVITNTDAEVYGGELELISRPTDQLFLSLGASLLDATAKNIPNPATLIGRDRDLVLAPSVTLNGAIQYEWELGSSGRITGRLDGAYLGEHFFDIQNHPATKEDGYFVGNARLAYISPSERYEFSVFVKNFTAEEYHTYVFNLTDFFGSVQQALGRPRWYGASIRVMF